MKGTCFVPRLIFLSDLIVSHNHKIVLNVILRLLNYVQSNGVIILAGNVIEISVMIVLF